MANGPPAFKPTEINSLFGFLKYPGVIRNDAITAVGAPSSVGFLVRAIYWLYLLVRVQFDFINGQEEEDQDEEDKLDNRLL